MLRISKKLDYALIVLVHLAGEPKGRLLSARDIAEAYGLPLPITAGILKTLAKHAIVQSIRGVRGGYALAVDPIEFTLSRIVEAIEGPLAIADCIRVKNGRRNKDCDYIGRCPVRVPVRRLHETLEKVLGQITLAELASWQSEPGIPAARPRPAVLGAAAGDVIESEVFP